MSAYEDNVKQSIIIKAIYELTKQDKNNINTADIRKNVELELKLEDRDFYFILVCLSGKDFINEIEPLENLIGTPPKNAVVSITGIGIRAALLLGAAE